MIIESIIFLIFLITQCNCNFIQFNTTNFEIKEELENESIVGTNFKTNNNIDDNKIEKLKVYDYGMPLNIQELYEIQNGILLPMAKVKYINIKQNNPNFKKLSNAREIVSERPFNFVIKSDSSPETDIYKKALLKAEEIISNAIEIKRTINVDVYIEDFCNTLKSVTCMSLVGMTYSPIYISLKESTDPNEREYAYPQALAKQLTLDKEVDFADHDLIIYLNTHMAKEDYSELIATHEIIHGLGFMGNGVVIGESIGMFNIEEELFSPYVYYDLEGNSDNSYNYHILGFLPFTIFEKFIVPLKNKEDYIFRSGFEEFYSKSVNISSYSLNALSSANDQFAALSDIYNDIYKNSKFIDKYREIANLYLTHDSLGFRSNDGEIIKLQSFDDRYLSSSTACHIAVPFKCESFGTCFSDDINDYDNEYLMYFSYPLQFKTSEMLKKFNNKYSLIGPKLLKILTTMGWTEKGTIQEAKTYYVSNDQFPDVYDNLFEINANKKLYEGTKNETFIVSKSISKYTFIHNNYYFFNIIIFLVLYLFL